MSVSEAQLEANRANAQKSTGPTTEEGKKRSALNGMRHGLTGAAFVMTDEDRKAWDDFSEPFIEALKPANLAERQFAHLVAQDNFRLNRLRAIEENTFALGHYGRAGNFEADHVEVHDAFTQARVFALEGKLFQNLSLYEQRINRNMHKNLKTLHDLQDRRKADERSAALEAEKAAARPKAKAAASNPQPSENKESQHQIGFGISPVPAASEISCQTRENAPPRAA